MKGETPLRVAITGVAMAAVAAHLIWPSLKVDTVTVILLLVSLVPWLGHLFDSLELPGGWKFQYRKLKEEAQQAKGAANSASRKAEFAISSLEPQAMRALGDTTADEQLADLIRQYNEIRANQKSGPSRTSAMTRVVSKMASLAGEPAGFRWHDALGSADPGTRLAGYAFLHRRPDSAATRRLTKTVTTTESTPFGQYWGIQALSRVIPLADDNDVHEVVRELRRFHAELRPGTDRYYELTRLLEDLV